MRFLKHILVIILGTYLFLIPYYYFSQKSYIFFPTKNYVPYQKNLEIQEQFITTADGEKLHSRFLTTPGATTTVLFFHGNAVNLTEEELRLDTFKYLKLNALLIDYREYGQSSGIIKKEEDIYNDAQAAWDFLIKDKKIEPQNIILWGRSLGGSAVLQIAQDKKVKAVILESTFSSIEEIAQKHYWFLPVIKPWLKFKFDNREKIKKIQSPILIIHSKDDEMIPFEQGQKLLNLAPKPKTLLELSGFHNSDVVENYNKYLEELKKFLSR